MGLVLALLPRPHHGELYKCAGPTMGHLQHFFLKTNAQGGRCARLELTEPLSRFIQNLDHPVDPVHGPPHDHPMDPVPGPPHGPGP